MADDWAAFNPAPAKEADPWAAFGPQAPAAPPEAAPEPSPGLLDRMRRGFKNIPHDIGDTYSELGSKVAAAPGKIWGVGPTGYEDIGKRIEQKLIETGMDAERAKFQADQIERKMQNREGIQTLLFSPIEAIIAPLVGAFRSTVSRPIEEETGFPKEVTEGYTMIAGAALGMRAGGKSVRLRVDQAGNVDARAIGTLPREADFKAAAELLGEKPRSENLVDAYHGSPVPFTELTDKGPYFFTPHPDSASAYAMSTQDQTFALMRGEKPDMSGNRPHVMPASLKMEKPFEAALSDHEAAGHARDPAWLRENGFDSAIIRDARDPKATEYIVLDRDQIRPRFSIEENLRRAWREDGVHPAEVVNDARTDAFVKHDITREPKPFKLEPVDEEVLTETGGRPGNLSAAVGEPPIDIPLSKQPAQPPGSLMTAAHNAAETLLDIGRDAQMLVAPMARGTADSMAIAKDFANTTRRNRWEWSRIDDEISKTFTPEQRTRMWNAADEESVAIQLGESREHQGLVTLEPAERAAVEQLQARAQTAWLRARDLGMVEGEGLPAYTPRMLMNVAVGSDRGGPIPLNGIGLNLRTRTGQMSRRMYLTAEETEAAAKRLVGQRGAMKLDSLEEINAAVDQVRIARDVRALPLATAHLEDAIAGRSLINNIKDYGARTGAETVSEGAIPAGSDTKWFTLDHPAFRTWRPKFETVDGKTTAVKDANGNVIFEQVPLYVHGDFEGPLRAVLTQRSGPLYGAAMALKGKTMSLIMNSPMIHNAVEWGRALPAMPGKVATFKVYFEGNRVKNDVAQMREAIDAGLVPIGKRFFKQDITSIMEAPDLTPGRSWTAKVLGAVPGLFDEGAGTAVKSAIDKAGDFWHNTLLWDRIADLQAGLYSNFRDNMVAKGIDRQDAARVAAHWANRYAGALPQEAMSDAARKVSNMLLFSRSFTMGNMGVMKDMLTGLPKDVIAQIERDAGFRAGAIGAAEPGEASAQAVSYAKTLARRKAMAVVLMDVGLMYVGNSILQSVINVIRTDRTVSEEMKGYADRFANAMQNVKEHPLALVQPFDFMEKLSSTSENEPGKQDRIRVGTAKDGTAVYMRNPVGKIGEEFVGYMSGPLDMMRRKLGTIARPGWQILSNDKGYGRKVYDPNADTPAKYLANIGAIAGHLAISQFPEGQFTAAHDLVRGEGDPNVNAAQALGPFGGVTFGKGAPGGPAVGELYKAREMHQFQVDRDLPDIRKQVQRGDVTGAQERMTALGVPPGLQRFYIKTSLFPETRLGGRTLRDFYQYATPEQRERLERARR